MKWQDHAFIVMLGIGWLLNNRRLEKLERAMKQADGASDEKA